MYQSFANYFRNTMKPLVFDWDSRDKVNTIADDLEHRSGMKVDPIGDEAEQF
jgi:hypothetical protein